MQKIIDILSKAALTVIVAAIATGCIKERYPMSDAMQDVMIQVNVNAGELTKATEASTDMEKVINSVRIYAYYDGKLSGSFFRPSPSDDPIVMDLELPMTGTHNVDFYVIANEASMTYYSDAPEFGNGITQAQLEALTFSEFDPALGLPMYYKETVALNVDLLSDDLNDAQGHEGHPFLTQKINAYLARPLAKLSLYVAKAPGVETDLKVNEVTMLSKGTRRYSYLLPQTQSVLETIPSKLLAVDMLAAESVAVTKMVTEGQMADPASYNEIFTGIYVKEVPFGSSNWDTPVAEEVNSMVLTVNYTRGTDVTVEEHIYLPVIQRNCHYKICCLINSQREVEITYLVKPWAEENVNVPEFN